MALHIILLGLVLLLSLGLFGFGWFSQNKAFFLGAFIVLMLSGVFIQAESGILLENRVNSFDDSGNVTWEAVEYSTSVPSVNLFAWLLVLVGGALTAYTGFAFVFSESQSSPYHF